MKQLITILTLLLCSLAVSAQTTHFYPVFTGGDTSNSGGNALEADGYTSQVSNPGHPPILCIVCPAPTCNDLVRHHGDRN